jgi:hypothetical protein
VGVEYLLRLPKKSRFRNITLRLALLTLFWCSPLVTAAPPFDTAFMGKTVVFLYPSASDGNPDVNNPLGTGFLIRVPHLHDD